MIPQPLLVLAPPNGEGSRVAAMLGAHPGALLLPEFHSTLAATVGGLLDVFEVGSAGFEHGLLRAVGAVFCGGQDEPNIEAAQRWLQRRSDRGTETLLMEFAERLAPRQLVVPDSSAGWRPDSLRLLDAMFPGAAWVHVLSHPRRYCADTLPTLRGRLHVAPDFRDHSVDPPLADPQFAWLRQHRNIERAIARRQGRSFTLRVEQLKAEPEVTLASLCAQLGWDGSDAAIAAMLQPERSVFAGPGPDSAIWGLDEGFIRFPHFIRELRPLVSLDGPLEWRPDGREFGEEVKQLAQQFGYR